MGLLEILAICILLGVLCAVGLLCLLLGRLRRGSAEESNDGHVPSEEALAALSARLSREITADVNDMLRRDVTEPLLRAEREGQATQRSELQGELRQTRTELSGSVQTSVERLGQSLRESQRETAGLQSTRITELGEALGRRFEEQDRRIAALTESERTFMATLSEAQEKRFGEQDKRIAAMQTALQSLLSERMDGLSRTVAQRLSEVERQFRELREQSIAAQTELRHSVEERLTALQANNSTQLSEMRTNNEKQLTEMRTNNEKQLTEMRATVDEKLQKTLDERISQSFKMVNDRLGEVYRGLGEMQALAGDVGDLKKVMSGVKTRGIYGEIRLGAIIEEILTPDQYLVNAVTRPGTANRVEFAVKLPGEGDEPVLLPIDAKFPADAYHHVVDAYESGDPERIKAATAELDARIKSCAKDIRDKYIETPYTTNFGILFLPFEGLYAEVVRMGLVDTLQQTYRVSIAGPTTLSALLNSLQMGFRTLAIQKRSGEVWQVLGAVKTEFGNFEKVLAKAKERIDQTGNELDKLIGTRTRAMQRKLRSVSELPTEDALKLLDSADTSDDPDA